MAWIRRQKVGNTVYYSVLHGDRRGSRVVTKTLEWLGKNPGRKKLAAAKKYWGVRKKPRKGGRGPI